MTIQLFVDGSWKSKIPDISGWGFIIFNDKDELLGYDNGVVKCKSRQIDGELTATIKALTYIKENLNNNFNDHSYKVIELYYDYMGIEAWENGKWKAKSEVAIAYINSLKDLGDILDKVKFIKVKAHSGQSEGNSLADLLAKEAIDNFIND